MALKQTPDHPAYDILSRAYAPDVASSIFVDKVIRKPLTLRPTSPDPSSQDARAARRRHRLRKTEHASKRRKPKRLSAREKKALGLYEIPRSGQQHAMFVPLHRLWLGYMREILGIKPGGKTYVTAVSSGSILASADYHGAELEVVRSRCVSRVGCKGFVVKDSKFTFEIITRSNVLKVIPKEHTIFRFEIPQMDSATPRKDSETPTEATEQTEPSRSDDVPPLIFELHGDQFQFRAPDRITKKFKPKWMDDL